MYCLQTYLYHNCIFRYSQFLIKITSQLSLIHHFHKSNILAWPNDHRNTKWTQKQSDRILKNPTTESSNFQHLKRSLTKLYLTCFLFKFKYPYTFSESIFLSMWQSPISKYIQKLLFQEYQYQTFVILVRGGAWFSKSANRK